MSAPRKRGKKTQQDNEDTFRDLFENANDAIATFTLDGTITSVNRGAELMLGWSRHELIGQHVSKVASPSSVALAEERARRFLAGEKLPSATFEVELVCKDGNVIPAEARTRIIRDERRKPIGFQGIYRDIRERKRAETALLEHARLAALGANVSVSLTKSDTFQGTLQRCADAVVQHLGTALVRIWILNAAGKLLELQASAGMSTHIDGRHSRVPMGEGKIGRIAQERRPYLIHPISGNPAVHDQDWAQREQLVAFAGYPLIVEERLVGVLALFSRTALSDATFTGLVSIADTIALGIERKRAEEALRQSEEYFRSLTENASDIIALLNSDGTIRYGSPAIERVLGYSPEDLIGKSLFAFVHPDDVRTIIHVFSLIIHNPGTTLSMEFRCQRQDSTWCTLESKGKSLLENPAVVGIVINIRDITERKQAERLIWQAKREWETTLDAVSDLILLTDEAGIIRRCNRAVTRAFKVSYQELIGSSMREVFYGSADPPAGIFHSPLSEEALQGNRREEVQFPRLDGWFTIVRHSVRPAESGAFQGFVYILTDISERKRLEEMLRERIIQPHDISGNLRKFRKELNLSQKDFGHAFGGYSQRQINSYESGEIEVPITLLLAIKNRGYSLDVVLASGKTDAITGAIGYLSSSQKAHEIVRQLVAAVLRILDQEREMTDEILQQLGIPHTRNFAKESKMLLDMLRRTGLSFLDSPEEGRKDKPD